MDRETREYLEGMEARIDKQFERVAAQFQEITDYVDGRFARIDRRFDGVDRRLDALVQRNEDTESNLDAATELSRAGEFAIRRTSELARRVARVEEAIAELRSGE
ncbi:hypothetical protein [Jannaschia sp. LMIT008]|uniref:hypothetical protein n=1 Tax=Jannaschia maritima TaxID=3032585 RepID=UPI002811B08E|nr:hypothetical protein [Jannaschia sp. LMIT008]